MRYLFDAVWIRCLICGFDWGVQSLTSTDPLTTIGFVFGQTAAMCPSPILVTSRCSAARAIPNGSRAHWGPLARGGLTVLEVPAGHDDMVCRHIANSSRNILMPASMPTRVPFIPQYPTCAEAYLKGAPKKNPGTPPGAWFEFEPKQITRLNFQSSFSCASRADPTRRGRWRRAVERRKNPSRDPLPKPFRDRRTLARIRASASIGVLRVEASAQKSARSPLQGAQPDHRRLEIVNILCSRYVLDVQSVGHQLLKGPDHRRPSVPLPTNGSELAKVTRVRCKPRTHPGNAFPRASSGKVVLRR